MGATLDNNFIPIIQCADHITVISQTGIMQYLQYLIGVVVPYLDHRTQLFIEQCSKIIFTQIIDLDSNTHMTGKGHLTECRHQTTIRTIMIRQ